MNNTTREALKELAQRIEDANGQPIAISVEAADAIRLLIVAAANAAEAKPGAWIDLNELMPEPEVFVLTWDGKKVGVDWWGSLRHRGDGVTHWHPFEKPPGAGGMYGMHSLPSTALPAPVDAQPVKVEDLGDGRTRSTYKLCTCTNAAQPVSGAMDERGAFEKWYSNDGLFPRSVERDGGGYKLMQAQQSWIAWQACAALSSNQVIAAQQRIADLQSALSAALEWIDAIP